jgi:hypothetical protein
VSSSPAVATALRLLDQVCAFMPPTIKLDLSERIQEWAHEKRRDAMDQLGLRDETPPVPPAPPPGTNGREPIDTAGQERW